MTLYFLDASAWVKRYFRERGSEWVERLFGEDRLLSASTLGLIEVNATSARKCGAGEIEREQFADNKNWLRRWHCAEPTAYSLRRPWCCNGNWGLTTRSSLSWDRIESSTRRRCAPG